MNFKAHWESLPPSGKDALAVDTGSSIPYLSQIAHGHRKPSPKLARTLWRNTGVPLKYLRPDIWGGE